MSGVEYYYDEVDGGIDQRVEIPAMGLTFLTVYPAVPGEPELWHTEATEDGSPIPGLAMCGNNKEN